METIFRDTFKFSLLQLPLFFIVSLLLISCTKPTQEEVERVTSPDSIVDAVLMRSNSGATSSFSYEVHIVPAGGMPKEGKEVLRADHMISAELEWPSSGILEIHYDHARIFHFQNFWQSREVQNLGYVIQVRLVAAE